MTSQECSEHKTICPLCGVECDQQEMTWSERSDQPCCLGCLAEEESCGCSDD